MVALIPALFTLCLLLTLPVYAAADATLSVQSTPPGVEVWLDDTYIGDTPIAHKRVRPGRYRLKLVDPLQHTSTTEELLLQPADTTLIEKTLTGRFGALTLTTRPPGCSVRIATTLGTTPLSNPCMNPGSYLLEIRPPGSLHQPLIQEVSIAAGQKVVLDKKLTLHNPFDRRALLRLGLGAATAGGFVWALVEQRRFAQHPQRSTQTSVHATRRTVGIVLGSVSLTALQIVAFF